MRYCESPTNGRTTSHATRPTARTTAASCSENDAYLQPAKTRRKLATEYLKPGLAVHATTGRASGTTGRTPTAFGLAIAIRDNRPGRRWKAFSTTKVFGRQKPETPQRASSPPGGAKCPVVQAIVTLSGRVTQNPFTCPCVAIRAKAMPWHAHGPMSIANVVQ